MARENIDLRNPRPFDVKFRGLSLCESSTVSDHGKWRKRRALCLQTMDEERSQQNVDFTCLTQSTNAALIGFQRNACLLPRAFRRYRRHNGFMTNTVSCIIFLRVLLDRLCRHLSIY